MKYSQDYYTYIYRDPRFLLENGEFEPFYVGKGKHDRAWDQHANKQFNGRLTLLKFKNITPIVEIMKTTSEIAALWLERFFISFYGRKDQGTGSLFNHTDGGENPPRSTPESNLKGHLTRLQRGHYNKYLLPKTTPEVAKKIYQNKLERGTYNPPSCGKKTNAFTSDGLKVSFESNTGPATKRTCPVHNKTMNIGNFMRYHAECRNV